MLVLRLQRIPANIKHVLNLPHEKSFKMTLWGNVYTQKICNIM